MSSVASEMKQVSSQQVCLILGIALILAGSVVGLAAMDKDVGSILAAVAAVAITVAGAFGWAKANQLSRDMGTVNQNMDHVKEVSNGRLTQVLEENKALNEKITALALLIQPPPEPK